MHPPKGRENTITSYTITEKNLIGTVKEPVENYDLMTAVMICLGGPASRNEPDVLRLLDVLFSSETGRKEGAAQTMLNSIKNVMETLGLTIEQAMSALKVPDADRPKYLERLDEQ